MLTSYKAHHLKFKMFFFLILVLLWYFHQLTETRAVSLDAVLSIVNVSSTEQNSASFEIIFLWILSAKS